MQCLCSFQKDCKVCVEEALCNNYHSLYFSILVGVFPYWANRNFTFLIISVYIILLRLLITCLIRMNSIVFLAFKVFVKTQKILKSNVALMLQRSRLFITPLSSSVSDKILVESLKEGKEGVCLFAILQTLLMSSMLSLYFFCLNLS